MKKKGPATKFWTALAMVNVFAMIYPISLLLRADNNDAKLVAILVFLGFVFLLAIADAVSIVVAYSL